MKKKYLVPIVIGITVVFASFFAANKDSQRKNLSDLTMENVEALTSSENDNKDCVLSLRYICTSGHKDHIGYRTAD